ncbi:MAG: TetR/AcrR family transcriptional regulator [Actinomycetota bacterium]
MVAGELDSPRTSGRGESRRAQILAAARTQFGASGYDQTSISDIATAVGVADGAIYKHFTSKREILYEVIREFYEPVIDMAATNVNGMSGTREQLRYLIWLQLRAFTEQPELCKLIIAEARPLEDYYESRIADLNRRYTRLLVDAVEEGQRTGEFRDDVDAAMVRDLVYGGIEHIAWGAVTGRRTVDPKLVADSLTSLVCNGLERGNGDDRLSAAVDRLEHLADRLER